MSNRWMLALLSVIGVFVLSGFGTSAAFASHEGNTSDNWITASFMGADDKTITLNVSEAHADYMTEERGYDVTDMMLRTITVERHEHLNLKNTNGEALTLEDIDAGDNIYIQFDIANYNEYDGKPLERKQLIVEEDSR